MTSSLGKVLSWVANAFELDFWGKMRAHVQSPFYTWPALTFVPQELVNEEYQ